MTLQSLGVETKVDDVAMRDFPVVYVRMRKGDRAECCLRRIERLPNGRNIITVCLVRDLKFV